MSLNEEGRNTIMELATYNDPAGYMAMGVADRLGLRAFNWPVPGSGTPGAPQMRKAGASEDVTLNNAFAMWPNPTNGEINIRTTTSGIFTLYDMHGREVLRKTIIAGNAILQLPSTLSPGIYVGKLGSNVVRLVYQP